MGMVHAEVREASLAAHDAAEQALLWLARLWDNLRDSDPVLARRVVAASAVVERVRAEVEPAASVPDRRGVLAS